MQETTLSSENKVACYVVVVCCIRKCKYDNKEV